DEPIRKGIQYLFNNELNKAKYIFQQKSHSDPLYALGLSLLRDDLAATMDTLSATYAIAHAQIKRKGFFNFSFVPVWMKSNASGLPPSLDPKSTFISNGILRALTIKAEASLAMAILSMLQETKMAFVKSGFYLKRAYRDYSCVWQEYQRMGQKYTRYMDRETVSGVQLGIGTLHLLISLIPPKIMHWFGIFGFRSDQQLGLALLKLCIEVKGIRSPFASLILLSYYSILSSFAPQLDGSQWTNSAIECLVKAQKLYPRSSFFLIYAGRISRITKNIPLSTQSFTFSLEASQKSEWHELTDLTHCEIGFNYLLQLDWTSALNYFSKLPSTGLTQYLVACCHHMLPDQRTESILMFASTRPINRFIQGRLEFFQKGGYQHMDFTLPALELLLVTNAFEHMNTTHLESCIVLIQHALDKIYEREKQDHISRLKELAPKSVPADYGDQRAILLLIKAAVLNSLRLYKNSIPHLNWIMDHQLLIQSENWILPFTYWEAGVTSWGLADFTKSRKLWQLALNCTQYPLEYRMMIRLQLGLMKCQAMHVQCVTDTQGASSQGRKRLPIKIQGNANK
ncbi:hypothetical protein BDB01DRAFT_728294, partial [Pilobolus umbonatus]